MHPRIWLQHALQAARRAVRQVPWPQLDRAHVVQGADICIPRAANNDESSSLRTTMMYHTMLTEMSATCARPGMRDPSMSENSAACPAHGKRLQEGIRLTVSRRKKRPTQKLRGKEGLRRARRTRKLRTSGLRPPRIKRDRIQSRKKESKKFQHKRRRSKKKYRKEEQDGNEKRTESD